MCLVACVSSHVKLLVFPSVEAILSVGVSMSVDLSSRAVQPATVAEVEALITSEDKDEVVTQYKNSLVLAGVEIQGMVVEVVNIIVTKVPSIARRLSSEFVFIIMFELKVSKLTNDAAKQVDIAMDCCLAA